MSPSVEVPPPAPQPGTWAPCVRRYLFQPYGEEPPREINGVADRPDAGPTPERSEYLGRRP